MSGFKYDYKVENTSTGNSDKKKLTSICSYDSGVLMEQAQFERLNGDGFTQGRTMQKLGSIPSVEYFAMDTAAKARGEDGVSDKELAEWFVNNSRYRTSKAFNPNKPDGPLIIMK